MQLKWHEVTWYSKLGAALLLFGVLPSFSFHVGTQYQLIHSLPPSDLPIADMIPVRHKPLPPVPVPQDSLTGPVNISALESIYKPSPCAESPTPDLYVNQYSSAPAKQRIVYLVTAEKNGLKKFIYPDDGYCLSYPANWHSRLEVGLKWIMNFYTSSSAGPIRVASIWKLDAKNLPLEKADEITFDYEGPGPRIVSPEEKILQRRIEKLGNIDALYLLTNTGGEILTRYFVRNSEKLYILTGPKFPAATSNADTSEREDLLEKFKQLVASLRF